MTTIAIDLPSDNTIRSEPQEAVPTRAKEEGHRAIADQFDYVTHFGSEELGREAQKINDKSIVYLRRSFDFLIKLGRRAKAFLDSCCARSGAKQGEIDFNYWLAFEGEPGHVTRTALRLYEWYESLSKFWQRFVTRYVKQWSFSCLQVLSQLKPKFLHQFFWAAELIKGQRKSKKIKATKNELKEIVKACNGARKLFFGQKLEIADWVQIFAVTGIERDSFDAVPEAARAIAALQEREEVWLEDAIEVLQKLEIDTRALEKTSKAEQPTKKTFTLDEVEIIKQKAIAPLQEELAAKKEEIAIKQAEINQLKQQLREKSVNSSFSQLISQKEAEIAAKEAEISELKQLLAKSQPRSIDFDNNTSIAEIFSQSANPDPLDVAKRDRYATVVFNQAIADGKESKDSSRETNLPPGSNSRSRLERCFAQPRIQEKRGGLGFGNLATVQQHRKSAKR